MYSSSNSSSNSQGYVHNSDAYLHQPARRNEVPHPSHSSQMNYGQTQFMGSTRSNGTIPYSNGSYSNLSMAPPPQFNDTAESPQHDYDQYMRDLAGSRAPSASATPQPAPVIPSFRQYPYATVHPNKLYGGGGHAHTQDSRGGQQSTQSVSSRGNLESSSSSVMRYHSSTGKPYTAPPAGFQTAPNNPVVDLRAFPTQLPEVMGPGPLAPTGYVVVPQGIFYCGQMTYPSIVFMPLGWQRLGNKAMKKLEVQHHPVELPRDEVLPYFREIIIKIQWPGYPHFQFQTPIRTKEGTITRGELVDLVCDAVIEFVEKLKEKHTVVNRDREEWMIGTRGLRMNTFFVARLIHRGGNYFQPEIWVPE